MAGRRKTRDPEPERTMVRIKVNRAFNGMYKGDQALVPLDDTVKGWVRAGLVLVVGGGNGTSEAGPGGPAQGHTGREPGRAEGHRAQGRQQG